ncbi:MAG: hypothetical protein ACREL3_07550 [Gemmatimonadales bacterium]
MSPLPGCSEPPEKPIRHVRVIGKARGRKMDPGIPREWTPVLDVHPSALRPDCLPHYAWLQFPDGRVREVHRQFLEFWYDPPGCALTDQELGLLRRIAAAEEPVMFQAQGRTTPAEHAFDHQVDALRDLRKAGWLDRSRGVARGERGPRAFTAPVQGGSGDCTASGREALEVMGGLV